MGAVSLDVSRRARVSFHSLSQDDIVQKIALPILKEATVSLAIGAVCGLFVATPIGLTLLFGGIAVQLLVNTAMRSCIAYHEHRLQMDPHNKVPASIRWFASEVFAFGSAIHANTLIHEFGHYGAALATLKNPSLSLELFPFKGGATRIQASALSKFGERLGEQNVHPFISGAGPALSCCVSGILMGVGLGIQRKHPETARMLIVSSLINFIVHAVYAFSAFFTNPTYFAHDFVALWAMAGLHPLVATIAILAIPA